VLKIIKASAAAKQETTTLLRIGLARLWEKFPDRCYLQITGIYTFPDYLRGRTFTDFVISAGDLDAEEKKSSALAKLSCSQRNVPTPAQTAPGKSADILARRQA
jgi:hypothetical protein